MHTKRISPRRKHQVSCRQCSKRFHPLYASIGLFCSQACSTAWRTADRHPYWRGDKIGYAAIHSWLKEHHTDKKHHCEHCGNTHRLEFAKKKGHKYTRYIEDYLILCSPCHVRYDGTGRIPWNKGLTLHKSGNKRTSVNPPEPTAP